MELLKALGFDYRILIAQLVNFAVLVFVLYRFGYKPILKFLDNRREKIEMGVKNFKEAQKKLLEIEEKEKKVLVEARKEAQKIINMAEEAAKKDQEGIVKVANEQSAKIIKEAEKRIAEEKDKILREVRVEVSSLVVAATEKFMKEKIDQEKDRELIEAIIKKG